MMKNLTENQKDTIKAVLMTVVAVVVVVTGLFVWLKVIANVIIA